MKDLRIYNHPDSPIAIAMTGAAFAAAQEWQVTGIEANLDAMRTIAQEAGFIAAHETLGPQVLVLRDLQPGREHIARKDSNLPIHAGEPTSGRYFTVADLTSNRPDSGSYHEVVEYAKGIGAPALTEVSITGWGPKESQFRAAYYAAGLLLGQKPLDLPPDPGRLGRLWKELRNPFGGNLTGTDAQHRLVGRLKRGDPRLPDPFRISFVEPRPAVH